MKDQVSKRETGFLARFAAFMLAAFMMISFFPTNASALSQEITVHQADTSNGVFLYLDNGRSFELGSEYELSFKLTYSDKSYNASNPYDDGSRYTAGAVLYGRTGGRWEQVSWISSELGGEGRKDFNTSITASYRSISGNFQMFFPKSGSYTDYKLIVGMADRSTEGSGMPFTELYQTNSYEFQIGQSFETGSSDINSDPDSDEELPIVDEISVDLDLYEPYMLPWSSVYASRYITLDYDIDSYHYTNESNEYKSGYLFIPTSSGEGSLFLYDQYYSPTKRYKINYNVSNTIYSGTSFKNKAVDLKFNDIYSFYNDMNIDYPEISNMISFGRDLNSKISDKPNIDIMSNYFYPQDDNNDYKAVGLGKTEFVRTYISGNNEQGYKVYIFNYDVTVTKDGGIMTIEISPDTIFLNTGDTYRLNVSKSFTDDADEITLGTSYSWESNTPSVATIDENGVISAVSEGNAHITCRTSQGITDNAYVYVDYFDSVPNMYFSRVVEMNNGESYSASLKNYTEWGNTDYLDFVGIISNVNYDPQVVSDSGGYITALSNGISTVKYVCGFTYAKSTNSVYYSPRTITSRVQKEYIIKVGDTSGGGNTPTEPDTPTPSYPNGETPTYIQPVISSDIISDNSNEVTIKNTTDLDIAYFKIDTNKFDGSLQIRINQSREASMRASGLIYDYAQSVGAKNYVYYPVNIDLYNTETKETVHFLPDGAKITFYITVPEEMLPLKNRLKVFHINSDNEMEMLESRITRKGGSICVRFDMDEFSPVALYVDDLTDEQFEEISAAAGYVTSKDEVVYVDYVGSGAGLSNSGFFAMDRSEQTAVCICAFVMFTAVISVSVVAGKKSRKK